MIRRTNEMKRIAILMPDNDVAATIMLEVRVFRLDSAFGSLAWARPGAIIRESSGEKMVWPIPDITRRRQLTGIALALLFFLIGLRYR
jgi:hypothetical protein